MEARIADGIAEQRTTRSARHPMKFRFPRWLLVVLVARLGACFPRDSRIRWNTAHSKEYATISSSCRRQREIRIWKISVNLFRLYVTVRLFQHQTLKHLYPSFILRFIPKYRSDKLNYLNLSSFRLKLSWSWSDCSKARSYVYVWNINHNKQEEKTAIIWT